MTTQLRDGLFAAAQAYDRACTAFWQVAEACAHCDRDDASLHCAGHGKLAREMSQARTRLLDLAHETSVPSEEPMKPSDKGLILDRRCDVTAFDLHLQLRHDGDGQQEPGSGRGVWFWLTDDSKERRAFYETWFKDVADRLQAAHPDAGFSTILRLSSEAGRLLKTEVHEAALLSWPQVEAVHEALGTVLEARRKFGARSPQGLLPYTLEDDRAYFQNHSLDRLLQIAWDWIHSARGMVEIGAIEGVSGAEEMAGRALRLLEIAVERMKQVTIEKSQ